MNYLSIGIQKLSGSRSIPDLKVPKQSRKPLADSTNRHYLDSTLNSANNLHVVETKDTGKSLDETHSKRVRDLPVPPEIRRVGQDPNNQRRFTKIAMTLQELVSTESQYCESLARTIEIYSEDAMPEKDHKLITLPLKDVCSFSSRFVNELLKASSGLDQNPLSSETTFNALSQIINCFLLNIKELETTYSNYSMHCRSTIQYVSKLRQKPDSAKRLTELDQKLYSKASLWEIEAVLIKPIQRLLQYPQFWRGLQTEIVIWPSVIHSLLYLLQQLLEIADISNDSANLKWYQRAREDTPLRRLMPRSSSSPTSPQLADIPLHQINAIRNSCLQKHSLLSTLEEEAEQFIRVSVTSFNQTNLLLEKVQQISDSQSYELTMEDSNTANLKSIINDSINEFKTASHDITTGIILPLRHVLYALTQAGLVCENLRKHVTVKDSRDLVQKKHARIASTTTICTQVQNILRLSDDIGKLLSKRLTFILFKLHSTGWNNSSYLLSVVGLDEQENESVRIETQYDTLMNELNAVLHAILTNYKSSAVLHSPTSLTSCNPQVCSTKLPNACHDISPCASETSCDLALLPQGSIPEFPLHKPEKNFRALRRAISSTFLRSK
ncbi:hypothetical protein CANCADRAFT_30340 [Tortispora caseinolytica NRRL Y-17796]|uniref:DH domain-containing protein n=1 Tax=Tortispora caseinolytica NRRL Y-17796 TaxID=767744 RepID=A0A1E4TK17_9ASCO|nr:hypothetical protein CANCADRAFT_30340 [Tortispora caseinolytica NRRL Y-17796]